MYMETLEEYVGILTNKFNDGKLSRSAYIRLTDKLIEWQAQAVERGMQ